MTEQQITRLLERAQEAVVMRDFDGATRLTLQAIVGISAEKDHFLAGQGHPTARQLADWFDQCSFVFNDV